MIIAVISVIVVLFIIILWAVFTNNSLIAKKNRERHLRSLEAKERPDSQSCRLRQGIYGA